jgi:hypothetical protein
MVAEAGGGAKVVGVVWRRRRRGFCSFIFSGGVLLDDLVGNLQLISASGDGVSPEWAIFFFFFFLSLLPFIIIPYRFLFCFWSTVKRFIDT